MVQISKSNESAPKDVSYNHHLIRLLYLSYFMATGCIQPFLSIYYHSLGFSGTIIGLIGSISPFCSFVVGPFWGRLSDKSETPFPILYLTSIMSVFGMLLLYSMNDPQHVMITVCITALFEAPVKPLIDSLVMTQLKDRSQFGRLRLFSIIGVGFSTSIAGRYLKDVDQNNELPIYGGKGIMSYLSWFWTSLVGYKLLFFSYAAIHVPFLFCVRHFQKLHTSKVIDSTKDSQRKTHKRFKDMAVVIFQNTQLLLLFTLVFVMGISAGLGEQFVYVRFKEVGGRGSDMGLSRLISSVGGTVMFWYSGSISRTLGMERVLALSFFGVSLRLALLFTMENAYHGYMAEFFRGSTFGCFWPSSTIYASQLSPDEFQGTMLQLLNGAYNGIGRSLGSIIGGKLQAQFGTAKTFLYGAIANAVFATLLALHNIYQGKQEKLSKKEKIS